VADVRHLDMSHRRTVPGGGPACKVISPGPAGAATRRAVHSGRVLADQLVRAWRAAGPLQGWLAWRLNARFGVGVTGIVRAADGRVLLLRHRFWPDDTQWGCPSGFAKRGERFQDTVVREVREETGLTVRVGRLAELTSGLRYRVEVYYEAVLTGDIGDLVLDDREILEARLFPLDALPAAMPPLHRELARRR
jgi:8-oxo-dGTP diphosphatase